MLLCIEHMEWRPCVRGGGALLCMEYGCEVV